MPARTLFAMGLVLAALVLAHLLATRGTGTLGESGRVALAVTPATTLSAWWRHLWAGWFHNSWGHLAFNAAVFALAFPFAARASGPWLAMANAAWIGPYVVLTLHLVLVLPLAHAGVPLAMRALHGPLVGFSVMAYALAGAALTMAPPRWAVLGALGVAAFDVGLAAFAVTRPFVFAYHLGGLAMGAWVRILLR